MSTTPAPNFGRHLAESKCPSILTNLGFLTPEPPCEEFGTKAGGAIISFCHDSDVLKGFAPSDIAVMSRNSSSNSIFKVNGFSSTEGNAQYNFRLSCHRTKRLARELLNAGVRSEKIEILARGPTKEFGPKLEDNQVGTIDAIPKVGTPKRSRAGTTRMGRLVAAAIARIESGDYRLAADAYLSFWTNGKIPSLIEAVRRTRILIASDVGIEGEVGPDIFSSDFTSRVLGTWERPEPETLDPKTPISPDMREAKLPRIPSSQIYLSSAILSTVNPSECVISRIVDLVFHNMVHDQNPDIPFTLNNDVLHAAALFFVELAGFLPCQISSLNPADRSKPVISNLWARPIKDPLEEIEKTKKASQICTQPTADGKPTCAIGTKLVVKRKNPIPEKNFTEVPQFILVGNPNDPNNPLNITVTNGEIIGKISQVPVPFIRFDPKTKSRVICVDQKTKTQAPCVFLKKFLQIDNDAEPFSARARVTLKGNLSEINKYQVGFVQTVTKDDATIDYVAGHRLFVDVPVPIRDGRPETLGGVPPWFESKSSVVTLNSSRNDVEVAMKDSPSFTVPFAFKATVKGIDIQEHPNNVINRLKRDITFNTWLVARRTDSPLDRFSTIFIDGVIWDFHQEVEVVGENVTGKYTTTFKRATQNESVSMQMVGPVPQDLIPKTPRNPKKFLGLDFDLDLRQIHDNPLPRTAVSAGALPFLPPLSRPTPGVISYQDKVRQIADPIRRELGLIKSLTIEILIDIVTGRIALESATDPLPVSIKGDENNAPKDIIDGFADRMFFIMRKDLVMAPVSIPGRPGSENQNKFSISLPLIPNVSAKPFEQLIDRKGTMILNQTRKPMNIREIMKKMWKDSVASTRETSLALVINRKTGLFDPIFNQGPPEQPGQPSVVKTCVSRQLDRNESILGTIHTHPLDPFEGQQEPSGFTPQGTPEKPVDCKREFADRDCVAGNTDACGLEHYVISRDFVFKYTKDKITEKKSRKVLLQMPE